ncbi:hypothetical protein HP548_03025 [Paenibacillus taichungensis]|uniref:Uncharacterized protein n=1 Tax=Paenibacillus taichungensis TaxID=484184 RepID=A0ABX2MEF9_9BACL|nr:hypothetical protein [Paenibacillus taichungensis]NUU53070.1 hypothetical protein [Paenibacillus taichungensis]
MRVIAMLFDKSGEQRSEYLLDLNCDSGELDALLAADSLRFGDSDKNLPPRAGKIIHKEFDTFKNDVPILMVYAQESDDLNFINGGYGYIK